MLVCEQRRINTKHKVQLQLMDITFYPEGGVNVKQESKLSLYSCDFANILKKVQTPTSVNTARPVPVTEQNSLLLIA